VLRLSKLTDYGIALLVQLARDSAASPHNARELSARSRLPFPVVGKVLKTLARGGLLVSQRGIRGGYALARPPAEISVAQIIAALEGPVALTECGSSPGRCEHEPDCTVRSPFEKINRTVAQTLERVTLADLVQPSEIIPLDELGLR
jgi:FeS assembly SUF system regulator